MQKESSPVTGRPKSPWTALSSHLKKRSAEICADNHCTTDGHRHNSELSAAVIEHMKVSGCAILYLGKKPLRPDHWHVMTWDGAFRIPVSFSKRSFHNMAGKDGRLDVWFTFDGSRWHGVNIGDNDIVRCKRTKEKAQ